MKKLGATINTLLQNFYEKKSEYEQAQKAMAQVLTNISHDIRTPLTVLKGNSEMLAAKVDDVYVPEVIHTMATKIDRKADDLITTINDYVQNCFRRSSSETAKGECFKIMPRHHFGIL